MISNDNKLYMCFVDMETVFVRVPRKVMELAKRKKSLSEVMVWVVISLYDGAKTRVRVASAYSEKLLHQGSMLSPLLFAIFVDVITENARRDVINELLYVDDLVLMSETEEDLNEKILEWERCTRK